MRVDGAVGNHGFRRSTLDLAEIERELNQLWREPTRQGINQTGIVPARTSVLNLVIYAPAQDVAQRAQAVIDQLAANHPSRAIILTVDETLAAGGKEHFETEVSTRCITEPGGSFAACSEQVLITMPRDSLDVIPSIVVPLALPDLPTFVWWPERPPLADRQFARIARLADRLIVDSLTFTRTVTNMNRLADLCRKLGNGCALSDLNWARLAHWREMTAQFFDIPDCRWALNEVTHLTVELGRVAERSPQPAQVMLYVGWLAGRLGWALDEAWPYDEDHWVIHLRGVHDRPIVVDLRSRRAPAALDGYLLSVGIEATTVDREARFSLTRTGDDLGIVKMVATTDGELRLEHAVRSAPPDLPALLVHELEEASHNSIFEDALQEVARYARQLARRRRT